jgi:CDP-paratose 2-epimerase
MKWLITGGCGFIGANMAARCLARGDEVGVIDDMSREGCRANLEWLTRLGAHEHYEGDIASPELVDRALQRPYDAVLHLAAQTAVTCSVADPWKDYRSNVLGTVNLLERLRLTRFAGPVIYSSTNKVYGRLDGRAGPVAEDAPLDFRTPYGCSKGAADQYMLEYARSYGLKTVVFRQSAIYGPRQHGSTDQGWVAHFARAAAEGRPVTIYGDGSQVRDVLYVDDLLDAYDLAVANIDRAAGEAFNIGGGPDRTLSVLELAERLGLEYTFGPWRPDDQKCFISDNRKATRLLGWTPKVGVDEGLGRLRGWFEAALSDTLNAEGTPTTPFPPGRC